MNSLILQFIWQIHRQHLCIFVTQVYWKSGTLMWTEFCVLHKEHDFKNTDIKKGHIHAYPYICMCI